MGRKKKITIESNGDGITVVSGTVEDLTNHLKGVTNKNEPKSIEIRGGTLDGLFCNYSYNHAVTANITNKCKITSGVPVHEDLTNAFKKLNPHLAVICEEISGAAIADIADIEEYDDIEHTKNSIEYKTTLFSVSAFRLDGSGDNSSVVLIGDKKLSNGDFVKLETPKTKFEEYQFGTELSLAIDNLVSEVEQYMTGKQAPTYVQQDLFEEESKEEGV